MIDAGTIQQVATRYQTTALNVAREYCQHLFLSAFYRHAEAERVLFKGGTALRIIYGSPRFSEDLDFSGFGVRPSTLETMLADTLSDVERVGIDLTIEEAKTTSGGYLGIVRSRFLDYHIDTQLEISLRTRRPAVPSTTLIASDLLPAYTLLHLPQELLVEEKLQALLDRAKARDFYDVYFMLRKGLLPPKHRPILRQVLTRLKSMKREALQELRLFLPTSHQAITKDFRMTLERELRRYLG